MNLLLVDDAEITGGRVRLTGRRAEHLRRVLRVEPGRTVRVGRIGGAVGVGRVTAVSADAVELAVDVADAPCPRPPVDVIVALPRPQGLKRVLQYGATMGVGSIALVRAWRVEKSYFHTPLLAPAAIRRQLLLGAEQGVTTWLPEVRVEPRFTACLERLAGDPEPPLRLLAHPEAGAPIGAVAPAQRVELAFGPEGGWIGREVESLRRTGFRPVTLGPWVLRVETALVAALAQLALVRRRSSGAPQRSLIDSPSTPSSA